MWAKKQNHVISHVDLSPTLHLTEIGPLSGDCGFWLYDDTQGMNLAVKAKTSEAALLEALNYYQKYLAEARAERDALRQQRDSIRNIVYHDKDEQEDW